MVSVEVAVDFPGVTVDGEKLHAAPSGNPEAQASATGLLNWPLVEEILRSMSAWSPAWRLTLAGDAAKLKLDPLPCAVAVAMEVTPKTSVMVAVTS